MSDVSSMFIVYLLELLTWHDDPYSQQVVRDLYNASKKAAQWQLAESAADGIPSHLVSTYDIVGLTRYPHDAYGGSFHLLAMKAAETLAYKMSMYILYNKVHVVLLTEVGMFQLTNGVFKLFFIAISTRAVQFRTKLQMANFYYNVMKILIIIYISFMAFTCIVLICL